MVLDLWPDLLKTLNIAKIVLGREERRDNMV